LIVRRVKDARYPDALFAVWRYHPFFTDSSEPLTDADTTHRRHGIIETVFADLIDGPLAHLPSGKFGANSAWVLCGAIAHNLLRAAGTLAGGAHAVARGATLRRTIIAIPHGWPARNDDPSCIYPATGHGHRHGFVSGAAQSAISSPQQPDPARHSHTARPEPQQEKLGRPTAEPGPHCTRTRSTYQPDRTTNHVGRFRPRLVVHA
jgi:hypothetical protein